MVQDRSEVFGNVEIPRKFILGFNDLQKGLQVIY